MTSGRTQSCDIGIWKAAVVEENDCFTDEYGYSSAELGSSHPLQIGYSFFPFNLWLITIA